MNMRKITITIEDENSSQKISGTTTLGAVNELYDKHNINGISQLVIVINGELNIALGEDIKLSLPDEVNTLPPGKEW